VAKMFLENTKELAQNKLLLLYIINESTQPLTNNEITEFILENNYMNYFLTQQYLSELVSSGFIEYRKSENKNKNVYILLDKGKSTLFYFEDRIPEKIKKEISSKFKDNTISQNKSAQVLGEYYKKDNNEYMVTLKLIEKEQTILSIYLDIPSESQAKRICDTWKKNTEYIYKNLLNMLVGDNIISVDD
jgi:predicted transcriptional regulator